MYFLGVIKLRFRSKYKLKLSKRQVSAASFQGDTPYLVGRGAWEDMGLE